MVTSHISCNNNYHGYLMSACDCAAAPDSVPSDEVYEKAVNMATVVYQLEGEGDKAQFVAIHDNTAKMLQVSILHPTKVGSVI